MMGPAARVKRSAAGAAEPPRREVLLTLYRRHHLVRGHVDLDDFTADAIRDPTVCTLAARTSYREDPTAEYPQRFGGRLRVHLYGGRVVEHHQPVNRSSAECPLTRAEVESKFRRNAARALSRAAADAVVDAIDSLERCANLSALTRPFRP
ncbi:MAG: MmgE/PrpD family protein [Deltaproteobacteria bacterium]|nr:MmgE/PrpD family protein [Deltaproteobacteria bacterium]MBI3390905.1 MmgE/PrpD family protein [Deltaproteobacteria bacterium]